MRIWVLLLTVMLPLVSIAAPAEEAEIVIELTGTPDKQTDGVSVWNKSETQLNHLFKGKTRTDVLYTITSISSLDKTLKNPQRERFFLVRYGSDDGDYRKFLFDGNERFLAAADNVKTVLRLNTAYQIDLGVTETDFIRAFNANATLTNLSDFAHNQDYQVYQLPAAKGLPHYAVFDNGKLINTYMDETSFSQFVSTLSAQNKTYLSEKKQAEKQAQLAAQKARQEQEKKRPRVRMRALVSGGTLEDQMYMPRLVKKQTDSSQTEQK